MTVVFRRLLPALALLLVAVLATPALAHKIKVFATTEGTAITGYVYFPGGSRPAGAPVTVTAPDGSVLGTMTTDAEGGFRFEATRRIDHIVTVDTGDGHRGSFLVKAEQLPRALAGDGEPAPGAIAGGFSAGAATAGGATAPAVAVGATFDPALLEDVIARAVAREVNPLREQLEAYEEKVRMHDILGGLGWIAGLTGIAFFVLARRRSGG